MYVAPRPTAQDDPHFAVRVATVTAAAFVAGMMLRSPMASIYPSLALSFCAGLRGAFDPARALFGPIALAAMIWIFSGIVGPLLNLPLLLVLTMAGAYLVGYFLILKTGNPAGMLITIAPLLMSTTGMTSESIMATMRAEMTTAALCSSVLIAIAFAIFPVVTTVKDNPVYSPADGGFHFQRAAIRAVVLLGLSFWLYAVLDASSMMLGVAAAMVLTFPSRDTLFAEAMERTYATVLGGVSGITTLAIFGIIPQFPVMVPVLFLGVLLLANLMVRGRHPAMVYQFAGSVMVTLVAGGLATSEPTMAYFNRVLQTGAGAIIAAFATSLLEALLYSRHQAAPEPNTTN